MAREAVVAPGELADYRRAARVRDTGPRLSRPPVTLLIESVPRQADAKIYQLADPIIYPTASDERGVIVRTIRFAPNKQ